ncbi:hypothetical protein EC07798_1764, partial [Escherichia coli 07798]
MAISKGNK